MAARVLALISPETPYGDDAMAFRADALGHAARALYDAVTDFDKLARRHPDLRWLEEIVHDNIQLLIATQAQILARSEARDS